MRAFLRACLVWTVLSGAAHAADSSYRVVGIEPSPKGARLKICYDNHCQAGGKDTSGATIKAALAVYKTDPIGGSWVNNGTRDAYKTGNLHKPGAIEVGRFADWKGTSTTTVELDYAKLGLKPGEKIWTGVNFFWGSWGHSWGDTKAGRQAGGPHVLPKPSGARKNSHLRWRTKTARGFVLRRLGAPLRPRWSAAGIKGPRRTFR